MVAYIPPFSSLGLAHEYFNLNAVGVNSEHKGLNIRTIEHKRCLNTLYIITSDYLKDGVLKSMLSHTYVHSLTCFLKDFLDKSRAFTTFYLDLLSYLVSLLVERSMYTTLNFLKHNTTATGSVCGPEGTSFQTHSDHYLKTGFSHDIIVLALRVKW